MTIFKNLVKKNEKPREICAHFNKINKYMYERKCSSIGMVPTRFLSVQFARWFRFGWMYRKRSRISQILFFCSMKIHITCNEKYPVNLNFLLKRGALSQFSNLRLIYCLYFQFFAKKYCLTSNIIEQVLTKFC